MSMEDAAHSPNETPSTDANLTAANSGLKTEGVEVITADTSPRADNLPIDSSKGSKENAIASHTPDWVPRCPHCGTANEYGQVMCDPVLPRVCQGGDDSGNDVVSNDKDKVWYEVISNVF
jgi:hypothetical protein